MHNRENWDDLRFVLAVTRHGSVTAAARELGVNHATVLRRVALFEQRNGLELFVKTVRGYQVAKGHQRILDALRDVENSVQGIGRAVQGTQAPLGGTVRVTSTDTFCHAVLPAIVTQIREATKNLRIELISNNAHLDLARLDADLVVRPAPQLPPDLDGTSPAQLGFALYAAKGNIPDVWLGLSGLLARTGTARWMEKHVTAEQISATGDSFLTLQELAAKAVGRVYLPCFVGDPDTRLVRIESDGVVPISVPIWVAGHRELVDVPRIRAVREIICSALTAARSQLLGEPPDKSANIAGQSGGR